MTVAVSVRGLPGIATSSYTSPALQITAAPAYAPSRFVTSSLLMILVVLAVVGLLLFALTAAIGGRSDPLLTRVGGFVSLGTEPKQRRPTQSVLRPPARPRRARPGGLLRRAARPDGRPSMLERLAATIELADIEATAVQIVLLTVAATALVALILDLVLGVLGVLAALVAVPVFARILVLGKLRRKRRAFAEQLPDNLDVLASALRAGHSLVSAMSVVAEEAGEPSRSEYKRVLAEEQFGVQLEDALKLSAIRMDNRDLEQVALVARLQREMGSNAAEVLDRVIETVRGRMELRRLVRTLTAQGRLSRWILTGLPVALAVLLTLLDASYMRPLLHELLGRVILILAVGMVALGSIVIGRIIDIKA